MLFQFFLDGINQPDLPIGAQGTAAIYTSGEHGAWAAAQDFDSGTLVAELAIPDQFLKNARRAAKVDQDPAQFMAAILSRAAGN